MENIGRVIQSEARVSHYEIEKGSAERAYDYLLCFCQLKHNQRTMDVATGVQVEIIQYVVGEKLPNIETKD